MRILSPETFQSSSLAIRTKNLCMSCPSRHPSLASRAASRGSSAKVPRSPQTAADAPGAERSVVSSRLRSVRWATAVFGSGHRGSPPRGTGVGRWSHRVRRQSALAHGRFHETELFQAVERLWLRQALFGHLLVCLFCSCCISCLLVRCTLHCEGSKAGGAKTCGNG